MIDSIEPIRIRQCVATVSRLVYCCCPDLSTYIGSTLHPSTIRHIPGSHIPLHAISAHYS